MATVFVAVALVCLSVNVDFDQRPRNASQGRPVAEILLGCFIPGPAKSSRPIITRSPVCARPVALFELPRRTPVPASLIGRRRGRASLSTRQPYAVISNLQFPRESRTRQADLMPVACMHQAPAAATCVYCPIEWDKVRRTRGSSAVIGLRRGGQYQCMDLQIFLRTQHIPQLAGMHRQGRA